MKSFVEYNIKKKEISLVFTVDDVPSIISTTKSWPIRKFNYIFCKPELESLTYCINNEENSVNIV